MPTIEEFLTTWLDADKYDLLGLRVLPEEQPAPAVGGTVLPSKVWQYDDERDEYTPTEEDADGVSVIAVRKKKDITRAVKLLDQYLGNTIVVLAGVSAGALPAWCVDEREALMLDPVVLAVFQRTE